MDAKTSSGHSLRIKGLEMVRSVWRVILSLGESKYLQHNSSLSTESSSVTTFLFLVLHFFRHDSREYSCNRPSDLLCDCPLGRLNFG